MFSPIETFNRSTTNVIFDNFPNFLNFVLLPEHFDPSDNYFELHNFAFDEISNTDFNEILRKIISKKNNVQTEKITTNVNKSLFMKLHKSKLLIIFNVLMKKTTLNSKGYKLKGHYLETIYINVAKKKWYIHSKLCVHKDDRAYGKIIDIKIKYNVEKDKIIVIDCKLSGIVPQQNIESSIKGNSPYDKHYFIHQN